MLLEEGIYPVSRILAPRFYININAKKELGHALLMIVSVFRTKDDAKAELARDNSVVIERTEDEINLRLFEHGFFEKTLDGGDMLNGKRYVALKPLIDNIWELEKERQTELVTCVKRNMYSAIDFEGKFPESNLIEMDVVLSQYAHEDRGKSLFVPISSDIFIKNTVFKKHKQ